MREHQWTYKEKGCGCLKQRQRCFEHKAMHFGNRMEFTQCLECPDLFTWGLTLWSNEQSIFYCSQTSNKGTLTYHQKQAFEMSNVSIQSYFTGTFSTWCMNTNTPRNIQMPKYQWTKMHAWSDFNIIPLGKEYQNKMSPITLNEMKNVQCR